MSTPLSPFVNARIEFLAPGGRSGPELGFRELPGQKYLLVAFLKNKTTQYDSIFANKIDMQLSTTFWGGYVVGFCPLEEGDDYISHPYQDDPAFDGTGHRPPGFSAPQTVKLTVGNTTLLNAQAIATETPFGDHGIGAMVRNVIGDPLLIRAERW